MKTAIFPNTDDAKLAILQLTGKSVDASGYIIESRSGERVISPAGEDVRLQNFAGIRKGSEIIITDDLPSLLEQADYIERTGES